jgi:hypothetical protein
MMEDKYACMRCKCSGAKSLVPYKIIRDDNGESVKFVGQLCERCYKELFETNEAPAPSMEGKNDE